MNRTKSEVRLRAQVAGYAQEFTRRLYAGKISAPGGGDCWGCAMVAADGTAPMGGAGHIRGHISTRERYYVPSLVFRALHRFGSRASLHNAAVLTGGTWKPGEPKPDMTGNLFGGASMLPFLRKQTQSAIRRFCLCELGIIHKGRKFAHHTKGAI